MKAGKGEADHACFSRGSQESSEGFGKFLRLENTAGGEGRGRCCAFNSVVSASTFRRDEGPESVFSPCILLSEARGDGWWEDAEPGRLWSLRDWENQLSQGERAEGFPELREQTTLPSAAGRAWPPPHPAEPPADFRSQSRALSEEQAPEG